MKITINDFYCWLLSKLLILIQVLLICWYLFYYVIIQYWFSVSNVWVIFTSIIHQTMTIFRKIHWVFCALTFIFLHNSIAKRYRIDACEILWVLKLNFYFVIFLALYHQWFNNYSIEILNLTNFIELPKINDHPN